MADRLAELRKIAESVAKRWPGVEIVQPAKDAAVPIFTVTVGSRLRFKLIPGGRFARGLGEAEEKAVRRYLDEKYDPGIRAGATKLLEKAARLRPVQTVTVAPFLLAERPLCATDVKELRLGDPDRDREVEEWEGFMGRDESDSPYPFILGEVRKVLETTGCLLPSESQWEYACRAGSSSLFFWGDLAPFAEGDYQAAHETNAYGLWNMGAVPELCADDWHKDYEGAPTDGSPWSDEPRGEADLSALSKRGDKVVDVSALEARLLELAQRELAENVDLSKEMEAVRKEIKTIQKGTKGKAKGAAPAKSKKVRPQVGEVVRGGCAVTAPWEGHEWMFETSAYRSRTKEWRDWEQVYVSVRLAVPLS